MKLFLAKMFFLLKMKQILVGVVVSLKDYRLLPLLLVPTHRLYKFAVLY